MPKHTKSERLKHSAITGKRKPNLSELSKAFKNRAPRKPLRVSRSRKN